MTVFKYIRHRWYTFAAVIIAGIFSGVVYWAEKSDALLYVLEGFGIVVGLFFVIDFLLLNSRIKKIEQFFCGQDDMEFSYPLDKIYISHIKKLLGEYKIYREEMQQQHANEIEFITKWVHDVKVPISAIKLLIESVDDELSSQLQMQTLHVEQNIQKILYHIKSKSLYEDYTIKQVVVKKLISQVLKQYAVFFSFKKIALQFACEDSVVATDEKWSGYMISQIISNAVKYTPQNGEIEIRAYEQNGSVVVCVKNTGAGISKQDMSNIFNRGFSAGSLRDGSTTGYGLYLSKKLADIMGHKLYAQSVQGEYAEFFLEYNITES